MLHSSPITPKGTEIDTTVPRKQTSTFSYLTQDVAFHGFHRHAPTNIKGSPAVTVKLNAAGSLNNSNLQKQHSSDSRSTFDNSSTVN